MPRFPFRPFALLAALALPLLASAHEVYVLSPDTVREAIATPRFSELHVILSNMNLFMLWGLIAILTVVIIFGVSILRPVERALDPILAKLPPYAPVIGRITIGISLLASAYFQALFGPELPLALTFGDAAPIVTGVLVIAGFMIIVGYRVRLAVLAMLVLVAAAISRYGMYMLTYANYVGEFLLLFILGAHEVAVHSKRHDASRAAAWVRRLKERFAPYAFLILRVAFGIALIYASLYAKVLHDNLALAVTAQYPGLVAFFGFEPHFLVLGAAIIEVVIGLFFILGIEIRFTALFVLFWLSLSLWYFGETVWPHIILIGIPIAFICYGYDKYSLEGWLFKRGRREPVL